MPIPPLLAVLLASDDSSLDLSNVSLLLAVATGATIVAWLLLLLTFAVVRRPKAVEAAAPTLDLGPEPPAVADLLIHRCHVTASAVPATLLDLAARDHLDVEEYGGRETIIRLRKAARQDLTPYERQVLEQVEALAEHGVLPLQALTLGSTGRAASWRKAFDREVAEEARARGLTEDRWSLQTWGAVRVVGAFAGALVVAAGAQAGSWEAGLAVVLLALAGAHALLLKVFGTQVLTESGYAAAAHWLGVRTYMADAHAFDSLPPSAVALWDRYLAYAAAFGLARAVLARMPMGAEDDHRAWSAFGGTWHRVYVTYPRRRFVWGRSPAAGVLVGLVICVVGGGMLWLMLQLHGLTDGYQDDVARWVRLASTVAAGAGGAVIAWGLWTIGLSLADLGARRKVEGALVRCRAVQRSQGEVTYYMAVDDGTASRIKAWIVDQATYRRLREGAVVRATTSRHLRHVYEVATVRGSREPELPSAAPETAGSGEAPGTDALLTTPALDPSSLVTADEAAEALGEAVAPARSFVEPDAGGARPRGCVYAAASGRDGAVVVAAATGRIVSLLSRFYTPRSAATLDVAGARVYLKGDGAVIVSGDAAVMIRLHGAVGDPADRLTRLATRAAERIAAPGSRHLSTTGQTASGVVAGAGPDPVAGDSGDGVAEDALRAELVSGVESRSEAG